LETGGNSEKPGNRTRQFRTTQEHASKSTGEDEGKSCREKGSGANTGLPHTTKMDKVLQFEKTDENTRDAYPI